MAQTGALGGGRSTQKVNWIPVTSVELEYGEALFSPGIDRSRRRGPEKTPEGGTFHVAARGALRGVAQAVAHAGEFTDGPV